MDHKCYQEDRLREMDARLRGVENNSAEMNVLLKNIAEQLSDLKQTVVSIADRLIEYKDDKKDKWYEKLITELLKIVLYVIMILATLAGYNQITNKKDTSNEVQAVSIEYRQVINNVV
jgi:hypothetical protein